MNGNRAKCRGFTVIELMMGMTITTLVVGAVSAFSLALSEGWRQSGSAQRSLVFSGQQCLARMTRIVQTSRAVADVQSGKMNGTIRSPACAVLWLGDANRDGKVQFSEIGLIEHNVTISSAHPAQTLDYYTVCWPAGLSAQQIAAADFTADWNDLLASTASGEFKALAYVTSRPLGRDVTGAKFTYVPTDAANAQPRLDFKIDFGSGAAEQRLEGSAALRAAAAAVP